MGRIERERGTWRNGNEADAERIFPAVALSGFE